MRINNYRKCKKINLIVKFKKRQVLDKITLNLNNNKRKKRFIFNCNICNISLCKNDPCWTAYYNSIWIVLTQSVQDDILWFSIGGLSEYAKSGFPAAAKGIRFVAKYTKSMITKEKYHSWAGPYLISILLNKKSFQRDSMNHSLLPSIIPTSQRANKCCFLILDHHPTKPCPPLPKPQQTTRPSAKPGIAPNMPPKPKLENKR